jgi:large subunit ribosomal protein L10
MSKRIKNLIATELEKRLTGADSVVIVDYSGISANDTNKLRGSLRKKNVRMTVVANAQGRRALDQVGLKPGGDILLGTNALVYGGESVVDAVKELMEQAKEIAKLTIKGSVVEGKLLDKKSTEALAKLPGRKQLHSEISTLAISPGRKLAGQIVGPGRNVAGLVKAVIEKKEKEAPAAAA